MIPVTADISLDPGEISFTFLRASGPGGQNVNKVETAVQLRFDAARSANLNDHVRRRLLTLAGRRATSQGVIVITAQRFRSQDRNRDDALARLIALIGAAAILPRKRVPTRPTFGVLQRRSEAKKAHATVKLRRRRPDDE